MGSEKGCEVLGGGFTVMMVSKEWVDWIVLGLVGGTLVPKSVFRLSGGRSLRFILCFV